MLLVIKIIGSLCAVAIPVGVCGAQAILTTREQEDQKTKIQSEIDTTKKSLEGAYKNYQEQIKRIQEEKNQLLTIKSDLTYVPINIQDEIGNLKTAKSTYETKHTEVQEAITAAITTHKESVTKAKTAIETLWTNEKTRVEGIQNELATAITTAKNKNTELQSEVDTLKSSIDQTINGVFNP